MPSKHINNSSTASMGKLSSNHSTPQCITAHL